VISVKLKQPKKQLFISTPPTAIVVGKVKLCNVEQLWNVEDIVAQFGIDDGNIQLDNETQFWNAVPNVVVSKFVGAINDFRLEQFANDCVNVSNVPGVITGRFTYSNATQFAKAVVKSIVPVFLKTFMFAEIKLLQDANEPLKLVLAGNGGIKSKSLNK